MVLPFVLGIIVNKKGQILIGRQPTLSHKPYPGKWDLPGGKLEEDETLIECIEREVKEEIGFDVEKVTMFDVFHHNKKAFLKDYKGEISGLGVSFIIEVTGNFRPTEMVDMHFAPREEIQKLDFTPWAKESLNKFFKNL